MHNAVAVGARPWLGGFDYVSSPTTEINDWSLANAARAGAPVSSSSYARNGNAYYHRVRDNGLLAHPTKHAATLWRGGHDLMSLWPAAWTAADTQHRRVNRRRPIPTIPLSSFFDAPGNLIWPKGSPATGDLKEKRNAC